MDGGIQGRGESKKDRADYVFAFDVNKSLVEFIDNDGRRSVLCIGGGDEVRVDDVLYSGKAAVAAAVLKNTHNNKLDKWVVYHYTNKEGYESILANGYILPENITFPDDASDFQVSGVRGILAHPSTPIYTIVQNIMYGTEGKVGRFYGRGEDMFDRADYVFAFLLPILDMVEPEFLQRGARFLSIGRGKRVDITEAFYHGPAADAFDGNGLNHSVFESKEEVEMYLQVYDAVNPSVSDGVTAMTFLPVAGFLLPASPCSLTPPAGMVRVYHYTNRAGYEGILKSGYIRPSDIRQGDASYGSSVYATELDPSNPFWTILQNNYDMDGGIQGRGESKKDRADYVFAFDVNKSLVEFIDNDGRRSVLCIGGGDNVKVDHALYSGKAAVAADALKNIRKKVLVYHYTNKEGYESILANGYILPEKIKMYKQGKYNDTVLPCNCFTERLAAKCADFQVSGVLGTLLDPSTPIYTILHNMYGTEGKVGRFYGRGEDMFDRADYVFAFLLPVDMVEWVDSTRTILRIGGGKRVDVTEAFYHGRAADAFDDNGLNHSDFESEEEVKMYRQIDNSVSKQTRDDIEVAFLREA